MDHRNNIFHNIFLFCTDLKLHNKLSVIPGRKLRHKIHIVKILIINIAFSLLSILCQHRCQGRTRILLILQTL